MEKMLYMVHGKNEDTKGIGISKKMFTERNPARKKEAMQVLNVAFNVATPQEFVEHTTAITRKRKRTKKLEVDTKRKKYKDRNEAVD